MTQRVSTVHQSEGVRSRRVKGLHRQDCTWFRQGILCGDPSRSVGHQMPRTRGRMPEGEG
jgi:hypothetical protein